MQKHFTLLFTFFLTISIYGQEILSKTESVIENNQYSNKDDEHYWDDYDKYESDDYKENTSDTVDLSFARKYEGKYKFQEICETEPLKSELKELLGTELHAKFIRYIAVQGPMVIENNQTLLSSCMAHDCTMYESSFLIDFNENYYYLGILDDEDVYVFSNNSNFNYKNIDTYPSKFLEWTKYARKNAEWNK